MAGFLTQLPFVVANPKPETKMEKGDTPGDKKYTKAGYKVNVE
jgi:hypothetical protein